MGTMFSLRLRINSYILRVCSDPARTISKDGLAAVGKRITQRGIPFKKEQKSIAALSPINKSNPQFSMRFFLVREAHAILRVIPPPSPLYPSLLVFPLVLQEWVSSPLANACILRYTIPVSKAVGRITRDFLIFSLSPPLSPVSSLYFLPI